MATNLLGTIGELTQDMENVLDLGRSGLRGAADAAKDALDGLSEGRLPLIGDLEDPFHGDVDTALKAALEDAEIAAAILGEIIGDKAREMLIDTVVDHFPDQMMEA